MTKPDPLNYKKLSDRSLLIEWPGKIHKSILTAILKAQSALHRNMRDIVLESVPAYHTLTLFFREEFQLEQRIEQVREILYSVDSAPSPSTLWELPVCYDDHFGPDLNEVAERTEISKPELIQLHCQPEYLVHFIGFLPGFLYLGGMDKRLAMPRKPQPRKVTPRGAVGIAGLQTGIYPQKSPGGWNIIGNCPVSFFDAEKDPPCFAQAGDRVVFKPIDRAQHHDLSRKMADWSSLKAHENG